MRDACHDDLPLAALVHRVLHAARPYGERVHQRHRRVHGWLWLEFLVALALIAYLAARAAWDQLPFGLPVSHEPLLIAATGLQFLLILIGFFAMPSTDGLDGFSVGWGFGAFLALIASIVAAGPVIYPAVKSFLDSRNAARV